ncbi:MAG: FG-GAP-like repeat-containing protein [bacterium]|nr:FG-GAP-like repeat-containing protein [bacterium]
MKLYKGMLLSLIFFSSVFTTTTNARVVTFTRVTVASGLNVPHGDWTGNIDGTSPKYELDIFATVAVSKTAVWYANTNKGKTWSASNLIWNSPYYNQEIAGIDLNNNGTIDAVSTDDNTAATGLSYLLLHTNSGGGTFTTTDINSSGISGLFRQMRFGDMEGDGDIDIIVAVNTNRFYTTQTATGVYWYENTGNLNFTPHLIGFCNAWKIDCFDNDVPKDGHLDIVVTECYHGNLDTTANCKLILYKNNGSESFSPYIIDNTLGPPNYIQSSGGAGVRCADFNNDGLIDIASGNASTGVFYWYKNTGGNSFQRYTIDANCTAIDGIDVGDFEPDGDMDIVVAGRSYWFRWYENDGSGNFTSHTLSTDYQLFDLPYVSYLDGDSCPDIVLTESSSSGHIFAYLNPCPGGNIEETESKNENYLNFPSVVKGSFAKIMFQIKNETNIELEITDITGRIKDVILERNNCPPGIYETLWNTGKNSAGVYFVTLKAGNNSVITKKITYIK